MKSDWPVLFSWVQVTACEYIYCFHSCFERASFRFLFTIALSHQDGTGCISWSQFACKSHSLCSSIAWIQDGRSKIIPLCSQPPERSCFATWESVVVTILESLNVDGDRPISEEVQLGESVTISHGNVVLVVVVRLLQREADSHGEV